MSITEIQKKTQISWATIQTHIKTLIDEEIIAEDGERYYLNY